MPKDLPTTIPLLGKPVVVPDQAKRPGLMTLGSSPTMKTVLLFCPKYFDPSCMWDEGFSDANSRTITKAVEASSAPPPRLVR
jgi:hypothetical protein